MKKGMKIALAVGVGFCLIGGILIGIGTSTGGKQAMQAQKQAEIAASTVSLSKTQIQAYHSMEIDLKVLDLKILPSGDDSYYISYTTSQKNKNPLDYHVEKDTLTLKENDNASSHTQLTLYADDDSDGNQIILYVPANTTLKNVGIVSDCSDIDFKSIALNQGTIQSDSGDFDFDACSLQSLSFTTDTGDIDLQNSTLDTCSFTLSSGDFSGEKNTYAGKNTFISDNGDISIEDTADRLQTLTIQADTSIGDLDFPHFLGFTSKADLQSFHYQSPAETGSLLFQTQSGDISIECDD
jgi:hypothetical protein